jgi:hypothetical protein
MKLSKKVTVLLLMSSAFVACKKEEVKLKDGELKVIIEPTVSDNNVVPGIFVKIYDPSNWTKLQEKELWTKKGEVIFTGLPKQSINVDVRMEYSVGNRTYIAKDEYTYTHDGSAKTITMKPQ